MQNSRKALRIGLVAAAALSAGCKLGSLPVEANAQSGLALTPAQAKASGGILTGQAKVTGLKSGQPDDGMSHVQVRLTVQDAAKPAVPVPHFQLEALPAAWTEAVVTLFSATANTGFVALNHSQTIPFAFFAGTPLSSGANFPPLRPASDYVARCFLRNDVGGLIPMRLAASQEKTAVALDAGVNTINFNLVINGNESSYNIVSTSSLYSNVVSDGYMVKGDTLDFNTGIAPNAPGVDHVDAVITGAAYGGGSSILGRITNPANFATFHWDSSINAGAPGNYVAGNLSGGNLALPAAGTVEFRAYHILDSINDVGKAVLPVNIYNPPSVTVEVQ